jgi:hypothetical protein
METLNKGDIEILTFGSFIGNHFVRENGKYVFQNSEMNRLGAKFDILEVFAIFKDNLLRDKYKIGRRENSSQPEIIPAQEEVKHENQTIDKILEDFGRPHIPFDENVTMYYPAIVSAMQEYATQQTAHLQQQLKEAKEKIDDAVYFIQSAPSKGYNNKEAVVMTVEQILTKS